MFYSRSPTAWRSFERQVSRRRGRVSRATLSSKIRISAIGCYLASRTSGHCLRCGNISRTLRLFLPPLDTVAQDILQAAEQPKPQQRNAISAHMTSHAILVSLQALLSLSGHGRRPGQTFRCPMQGHEIEGYLRAGKWQLYQVQWVRVAGKLGHCTQFYSSHASCLQVTPQKGGFARCCTFLRPSNSNTELYLLQLPSCE